jgi:hypothetical protein
MTSIFERLGIRKMRRKRKDNLKVILKFNKKIGNPMYAGQMPADRDGCTELKMFRSLAKASKHPFETAEEVGIAIFTLCKARNAFFEDVEAIDV